MLAIAYSASIGGVGTLIGTPPNALLASFLQSNYDIEVSFASWMLLGIPIVLIMLPLTWLLLTRILFPAKDIAIDDPKGVVEQQLGALGSMSRAEKLVGLVFIVAAAAWILRTPLVSFSGLPIDDSMIAMAAALILFAIPVSRSRGNSLSIGMRREIYLGAFCCCSAVVSHWPVVSLLPGWPNG